MFDVRFEAEIIYHEGYEEVVSLQISGFVGSASRPGEPVREAVNTEASSASSAISVSKRPDR